MIQILDIGVRKSGGAAERRLRPIFVLPDVGSPHHLVAQGIEENVAETLDDLDGVGRPGDGEAGGLAARLAAAVDGHKEIVAAALDVEGDGPVVADDDGSHVEAVGGDGSDSDGLAVGHDDGAAHTERVGRGAGGSGHDEAVGLVGGERSAVDGGVDADHGRAVALEHGYLVEGIGTTHEVAVVARELEHAALFDFVVTVVDFVEGGLHLVGRHVGQEAETAGVDAEDGDVLGPDTAGGLEKRAVAALADDHVGFETVTVEQLDGSGELEMQLFRQEAVELPADADSGSVAGQNTEQTLGVRGLFGLIRISEDGKFHTASLLLALQRCYFFIIFLLTYDYYLYFCPKQTVEL